MSMTMGEKIIASAAGVAQVKPGEIHIVRLDQMMTNDATTHLTLDMYQQELNSPRLADNNKLIFVIDHNFPADCPTTASAHRKMRLFARENNIILYEGQGICHQLMIENHVNSGELIVAADSHTCSYGALGAFGTGVGCTDLLYGMVTGTTWMMVPETIQFHLTGELPEGVFARDLMLTIIRDIGANGCNYKIMEFVGDGIEKMSIDDRIVLANLAVEAGAKSALMEADEKVVAFLGERGRKPKALFKSDEDAVYAAKYQYDLSKMEIIVARPDHIDDVVSIDEIGDVSIDQAFIGSCNNGRIEELRVAASILHNKKVNPKVRMIISPASNDTYLQALREGLIETLNEAGAMIVNSNCSVCWGGCQGVLAAGEVLISTGTRNFRGRAGHPDSKIYLGSAATVAASAIAGKIMSAR